MHETDTMQALCWNARALAVHHQSSSWKHWFNLHRGRELRIFRPILREENLAAYRVLVFG